MFRLTEDSKTAFYKGHKNTFGFTPGSPAQGGTCPGATFGPGGCMAKKKEGGKVCTCYMDQLTRCRPNVKVALDENTEIWKKTPKHKLAAEIESTIRVFVNTSGPDYLFFRLFYSGDIPDEHFARALVKAIQKFPKVTFWIYTRSLFAIPHLVKCKNTRVYISMDPVNKENALEFFKYYRKHKNLAISWMGNTPPTDLKLNWVKCPATNEKFKSLLQNTPDMGACAKCKICFTQHSRRINVSFPIH